MHLTSFNDAALIAFAAVVVVLTVPVWLAAKITGAENPSFIRSAASLVAGTVAAALLTSLVSGLSIILVPLAYLLSFKFILGSSLGGSVLLAAVALGGYLAIASFVASRFT